MSKSKHTPGPWAVTTGNAPLAYYITHREQKGKRHVSYMVAACGEDATAKANANLIAQAPAMLEVLTSMLAAHDARRSGQRVSGSAFHWDRIRNILRAVEGDNA